MAQSANKDPSHTEPGKESHFIPIVVLVSGVVGGLVLVISVILCCKYCIKRKKVLRRYRQPVLFKRASPQRNRRPYHLYESLGTTVPQDGTTSKQEPATASQAAGTKHSKYGDDEEVNIDFAVAMYKESLRGKDDGRKADGSELRWMDQGSRDSDLDGTGSPTPTSGSSSGSWPATAMDSARYTDGDFQHLKKIKLERLSGTTGLTKQRSVGLSLPDSSREPRYEPYGSAGADDLKTTVESNGEGDLFSDLTAPILETLVEESPSPPGKPHHTEVSVEVHREAGSSSGSGSTCRADSTAARSTSPPKILDSNGNHTHVSARHSLSLEAMSGGGGVGGDRLLVKENRKVKSFEEELCKPDVCRSKSSESSENSKESHRSKSSKGSDLLHVNEAVHRGRGRSFDGGRGNDSGLGLLQVPESRQRGRSFDGDMMRGDLLRIPDTRRGRSFDGGNQNGFAFHETQARNWGKSFDSCVRVELHVPAEPRRGKSFDGDVHSDHHRSVKIFENEPRPPLLLAPPPEGARRGKSFESDVRLHVPIEPRRGRSFDGSSMGGGEFFQDSGRGSRGKSFDSSGMQLHVPEARRGRSFDAGTRGGLLPPERRKDSEASSNNFLHVQETKRGRSFDGDLRAGFNMNDTRRTKSSGAELFRVGTNMNETARRGSEFRRGSRNLDSDVRVRVSEHRRPSRSFEGESRSELKVFLESRRARSFEAARDYDALEITQFNRGPFYNADFDVMLDEGPPELRSKVRYNDTGSFEDVTEDHMKLLEDLTDVPMSDSDDTETLNGAQKYRELWNLRATLEEEEDFSDTIRMEITSSGGQSPEDGGQVTTSVTTSFESNTDPVPEPPRGSKARKDDPVKPGSARLLHPNYENRRQTYRSILSRRLQPRTGSAENSFDSVDTLDTDGEVSESSRQEVTTTSFDSTTDNTDSTGDSAIHRLQQMRGDSGYKSLETQQTLPANQEPRRHIHFALDDLSPDLDMYPVRPSRSPEEFMMPPKGISPTESPQRRYRSTNYTFDRRNGKTASKKRREYGRERHGLHLCETVSGEPETDSRSDQFSGDSFDEHQAPSKFALFARFFKSPSKESKRPLMSRDYSIDEKTNALFHEFMRYDPHLEHKPGPSDRLPARFYNPRQRLCRKHTEPSFELERRRVKLAPEMRSVSLGSDSSTSSIRHLSPQDSVEEEYPLRLEHKPVGRSSRHPMPPVPHVRPTSTIHEIPIIRLPEGESGDG